MLSSASRSPAILAIAVLAPLAVCGLLVPFRGVVANANAALLLVLVVVAVAATGQRLAGVLAALSSAVWFDVLLTVPYGQFAITDPDDVETAVLLTVAGLAVTEIALWGRRQQSGSSRREGYLAGVVAAARIVASGGTPVADLVERVAGQITDILDLDACRFDPDPAHDGPELDRDGAVSWNGRAVDVGREGLPTMDEIHLVVENGGTTYGRYVLTAATKVRRPDLEQLLVVVTLAEQVAAALAATVRGRP
jgi:K+-sensing histidine kinase KdpD